MKKDIFVVDDDDDFRESISDELSRQGYATRGAKHGESALSQLRKGKPPDLVLLDLMMPERDGWEVVAALKNDDRLKKVPIVLMSAIPPQTTTLSAQGVAAAVPKPFTTQELLFVISQVLNESRSKA
jgi:CheY-like chemotaxis protein